MWKKLLILLLPVSFILLLSFASGLFALSGYSYSADITFTNDTASDIEERLQFAINAKALGDGGYCQSDFDDVVITENDIIDELTIIGINEENPTWLVDYTDISSKSDLVKKLYMGNSSGTKNQRWIASGSDTITSTDHNDLDLETEFMLKATVELYDAPSGSGIKYPIISKNSSGTSSGYSLDIVSGTPTVRFTVYDVSGSPTQVSLDMVVLTEYDITAWYISGSINLDIQTNSTGISYSGSVSKNTEDVHICEFNGYCDDIMIRSN